MCWHLQSRLAPAPSRRSALSVGALSPWGGSGNGSEGSVSPRSRAWPRRSAPYGRAMIVASWNLNWIDPDHRWWGIVEPELAPRTANDVWCLSRIQLNTDERAGTHSLMSRGDDGYGHDGSRVDCSPRGSPVKQPDAARRMLPARTRSLCEAASASAWSSRMVRTKYVDRPSNYVGPTR